MASNILPKPQPTTVNQSNSNILINLFQKDGPLYGAIYGTLLDNGQVDWRSQPASWKLSCKKLQELYDDPWQIVGKRFNSVTHYCLFDIDRYSRYHPTNNFKQWSQLWQTLEEVGLARPVIVQSSTSEGIHLYYPFAKPVKSWLTAKRLQDYLHKTTLK